MDHATSSADTRLHTFELDVGERLRPWVTALVATEVLGTEPVHCTVAPHDAWVLAVQSRRGGEGAGRPACTATLTGVRQWAGRFREAGDCTTLFALLTPLGVVELLSGPPLQDARRICAPVSELIDPQDAKRLEQLTALADTAPAKLRCLAGWLERRAELRGAPDRGALRAARAATRLLGAPATAVDTAADEQHVSRRQLERDFSRWLGTSPRHWSRVAKVQALSRRGAHGGATPPGLAALAADLGFSDQAHMSHVVKQLTGLSPARYLRAAAHPLGAAFRRVTQGGTVYL